MRNSSSVDSFCGFRHTEEDELCSQIDEEELPGDVSNLVQKVGTDSYGEFSEASLAKARNALNELDKKAWIESDDKLFEYKGFEDTIPESYAQANRDVMRCVAQITIWSA